MMTQKRVLIFIKGIFDTMDLFTDELIQAFEKKGYSCITLSADDMDASLAKLEKQLGVPCRKNWEDADCSAAAAVITFNNMGYNLGAEQSQENVCLWEHYHIPYYNILMDHPFHYSQALKQAPTTTRLYCIDQRHVEYVKRFFKNMKWVSFLPHAGTAIEDLPILPIKERPVDVLYAGSLSKYRIEMLIPDFDQFRGFDAGELCNQVLQELVKHPNRTTEDVIEDYFSELELPISEEQLGEYISAFRFLDAYAVSFYREMAVKLLVENGIRVAVYGEGWDRTQWADHPNLIYGGSVPAPQVLPLMHQSKIVLNTLTWFKSGAHDRIFNGMLAGAVVVSDPSSYLEEQFENHQDIELFRLEEIQELPAIVEDLLADLDQAQSIADAGRQKAENCHLWSHRADEIERTFSL